MALIKLAQAFPRSTFVGYDVHAPAVTEATANAEAAGVADRVRFEQLDVVQGLPETYDMITTFDVVHDMADPRGALRAIRQALDPDGVYLMLDVLAEEKPHENTGPFATLKAVRRGEGGRYSRHRLPPPQPLPLPLHGHLAHL